MPTLDDLAERIDRLLLRHEETLRAQALLTEQLAEVSAERDALRLRLGAMRSRIDGLLARWPDAASPASAAPASASAMAAAADGAAVPAPGPSSVERAQALDAARAAAAAAQADAAAPPRTARAPRATPRTPRNLVRAIDTAESPIDATIERSTPGAGALPADGPEAPT